MLGWLWRSYGELRPATALRHRMMVEAAVVGVAVFSIWIWLGPLIQIGEAGPHAQVRLADGTLDPRWLAFRIAGSAFVVLVIEELFWRSSSPDA